MLNNRIYIILLFLFLNTIVFAQEKHTFSGSLIDETNNEKLIGIGIYFPELKKVFNTNEYGFFSITLPSGEYEIRIAAPGYEVIEETITLTDNLRKDFSISPKKNELKEVVINGRDGRADIRKPEMSVNKLSSATIKKIPAVLGEVDVIKALLLLPGVTNGGEASSGFNVRGGAADQNLILLDEATIYNSSHLFGFFSVFNPDAVKDLKLYKGGIPAQYGGRASSVLEIYQKEGNSKQFQGTGGIGVLTSNLLLEGPIVIKVGDKVK